MSVGIARLREEPDAIRQGAIDKGEDPTIIDAALEADARRRTLQGEGDALRAERNAASKSIGDTIKGGAKPDGPEVAALRGRSTEIGTRLATIDAGLSEVEASVEDLLLRIPNPPESDIPVGGEEANVTIRTWGDQLPHDQPLEGEIGADAPSGAATWARRPHWEIAEALGMIDLARGAKIAGSGFPVYKGTGSALQRALIMWFLDVHTRENGFTEVWPPIVVNQASARGTGQIPDKEDQMYVVTRDDLYLVPTAEVPVTNLHRDEILDVAELPIRYAAYTPCFRREAGAAGKDTRGILRVHQFDKVEMVLFERPEASSEALEWMTGVAEELLKRLGLAYRVLLMATKEMGFTQARKYDLEVWSPGVERWLEVSSCSNFKDFQARRMAVRYRPEPGAKPELVHTLNGSGLALARIVAAILETYQRHDGSVDVPAPLRPYMGIDWIPGPAAAASFAPTATPGLISRPVELERGPHRMSDLDVELPDGFRLVSLAERPDLIDPAGHFNSAVWPEFMFHDPLAQRYWHLLETIWAEFQLVLLDPDGEIAATNNSAPIAWDGTDHGLPEGWDAQFERSVRGRQDGTPPTTLGAIQIVVDPARRGNGLAGIMIQAMRANARAHGWNAVIACVRPTDKHRYPLIPIEEYAFWVRPDGEPFDAWIRLHSRLGGRIVRGCPRAMAIRGTVAEWEEWTSLTFPGTGAYIVPLAAAPVAIDIAREEGVYYDPNVWMVHAVGPA